MSLKAKIEAVLFMTEKPLRAQAIAGIVGEDLQLVRTTLLDLIHEYEERQGGLEIADEDGYAFQVKDQYANLMDQFLPIEMSAAQLRTLSAIAIKQPISQSEIIRIRGAGAYDHIKELVLRGLVSKREDEGNRSPLLSTTKAFQEYFRLTKDGKSLRQYLKREMKKKDKTDELPPPPVEAGDVPVSTPSELAQPDHAVAAELAAGMAADAATESIMLENAASTLEQTFAINPLTGSSAPISFAAGIDIFDSAPGVAELVLPAADLDKDKQQSSSDDSSGAKSNTPVLTESVETIS